MESSFPKCPVCGQSSGYLVSGIMRNYVQCQFYRAKWRLFLVEGQLSGLLLHELPKNGSGLWRVEGLNAPHLPSFFVKSVETALVKPCVGNFGSLLVDGLRVMC